MKRMIGLAVLLLCAAPALANDVPMLRILACTGPDATMEVFVPESAVSGRGVGNLMLNTNVNGFYALDLTGAEKGKHLEPVHVHLSGDEKFLIVEQYQRGLPATRVPVGGGKVDFDDRFATGAKCGPVNAE